MGTHHRRYSEDEEGGNGDPQPYDEDSIDFEKGAVDQDRGAQDVRSNARQGKQAIAGDKYLSYDA